MSKLNEGIIRDPSQLGTREDALELARLLRNGKELPHDIDEETIRYYQRVVFLFWQYALRDVG